MTVRRPLGILVILGIEALSLASPTPLFYKPPKKGNSPQKPAKAGFFVPEVNHG